MAEAGVLERRSISAGEFILRQGDVGNNAFLIQSGDVSVSTEHDGKRVELARMGPGQIIGEMALIGVGMRTATVQAVTDCNLIVITREILQDKLQKSDPTIRALVTMLIKRIEKSNKTLVREGGNLDDMADMVRAIYDEMLSSLPVQQKKSAEIMLLPPIDAFLKAVKDFRSRYEIK